jgi:pyruvate dehydrogenase (quinone)
LRPRPQVAPAPEDVSRAIALIDAAKTIAVFCGAGCRGAEAELVQLSDRLKAPLTHTYRAQELLPYRDPRWIGGVGLIGGRAGVDVVQGADLLLMLGTDYPYVDYLPKHGNIIQIDERAVALGRRAAIALGVAGSVKPALQMLLDGLAPREDDTFFARATKARRAWDTMLDEKSDPARSKDKIHRRRSRARSATMRRMTRSWSPIPAR